jgi:hypothetical protein
MKSTLFAAFAISALALARPAGAVDVPSFGDALLHQVTNADAVAVGELLAPVQGSAVFGLVETLAGQPPPARFEVDVADGPGAGAGPHRLDPGGLYLLFLRAGAKRALPFLVPGYDLAVGFYSARRVSPTEVPLYRAALGAYRKPRAADRGKLLANAESPVPYIQYSAVADLNALRLFAPGDVDHLADLLKQGKLSDRQARKLVVRQIEREKSDRHVPLLQALAGDPRESVAVRAASVNALASVGAVAALKAVAPSIEQSASPRLKAKLLEAADKVK